ncbi:McrC family protein [Paraclostridium sordellii]|uniref:McrC family protein n=1 Tax=Paraclostridium sordellii TaxID=1505 RepID=UPI0005E867E5|nr:hypothetical protein [Paeniclostridium sordellii]CEQ15164.1 5-methylcytosine-specific restriction enzyme C [[Clostridium] sordellii] [Paeniclostridium sordellii]
MNCKYICVREAYDYIDLGDKKDNLTSIELKGLTSYLSNKYNNKRIIEFKQDKIRFINYTGIIALDNLLIEILPKISLSNNIDKDRKMLIQMLTMCNKLPLNIEQSNSINTSKNNLLDILVNMYIENLENEVRKGFNLEYISESANINTLKGKLLLKEHINKNYINKSKVYCNYDNYSYDNFLNQTFKHACTIVLNKIYDEKTKSKIKKILKLFVDVSDYNISLEKLNNLNFDRRNERFKLSYEFAKLIIKNESSKNTYGYKNAFSILFEMNILYEEYIGKLILKNFTDKNTKISLQDKKKRLLTNINTNKKNILLKPDIVLYKNDMASIIIDTKWKRVGYNSIPNYNQSDIYQMYAYVNAYKDSKRCILLYPNIEDKSYSYIWKVDDEDKYIEIRVVRLDSVKNTLEDLKNIIS